MTLEHELDFRVDPAMGRSRNPVLRKYLEMVQDVIVLVLSAFLLTLSMVLRYSGVRKIGVPTNGPYEN
jgi:hypothetical protein